MKGHRSLTRRHILAKGPAQIALMVASEFGRAANRPAHRENVLACYTRARELMGILETIPLPMKAARRLKPLFKRSTHRALTDEAHLAPRCIERSCRELADEFAQASLLISSPV